VARVSAPFDPWAVLGLAPGASVAEARAARRRLAKQLHPDRSGDGAAMVLVNRAVAEVEAGAEPVEEDSFSIPLLPAEAFEALFVVGYALGEVLVADEPYRLELYLDEPLACFCALSLVPEAGGSIVTIDLTGADGRHPPSVGAVRDALLAELSAVAGPDDGR
jgi:hypothetical protein